jgi:hypothetical protein
MEVEKPFRVTRSYVQKIAADPEKVFPLLCPVLEKEWVEGWDPIVVYSSSGVAELDCVFITGEIKPDAIWTITEHDPERFRLEIIKVTFGMTVGKINISLERNAEGTTDAHVTYMYTALSEEGADFVESYTEEYFIGFMEFWENALNEHIRSK